MAGRPTKYKPEYDQQAYELCLLGMDDNELASALMVDVSTINNWKNSHPLFFESIRNGKEIADAKVAASLYEKACGYTHDEEKIFCHDGAPVRVQTKKHYAPDTRAAELWLRNRQGKKWNRAQDKVELSGDKDKPVAVDVNMSAEDLAEAYDALVKRSKE